MNEVNLCCKWSVADRSSRFFINFLHKSKLIEIYRINENFIQTILLILIKVNYNRNKQKRMATTNQPGFQDYNNEWSSGLMDCCSDPKSISKFLYSRLFLNS